MQRGPPQRFELVRRAELFVCLFVSISGEILGIRAGGASATHNQGPTIPMVTLKSSAERNTQSGFVRLFVSISFVGSPVLY
jgi:hypothetical protein